MTVPVFRILGASRRKFVLGARWERGSSAARFVYSAATFGRCAEQLFERLWIVILVLEFAGEIVGVGLHVEMAVAGQVEEDGGRLAFLARLQRLVDRGPTA